MPGRSTSALSKVETDSALERPRTKDVRRVTSPFAARVPVNAAGGMLLWMSRPGEALLGGLSGGAQHTGDGDPGGVVLAGADHGGLQLFVGVDEVEAGVGEQGDGVGFSGRQAAARLAFAEGAALCVAS